MAIGTYRHLVSNHDTQPEFTWACSLEPAATTLLDGQAAFFLRGRFEPRITTETKIMFEGRTLQVQAITDVDERHVSMQVFAVEVVARAR